MSKQKGKNFGSYLKIALTAGSAPSQEDLFSILFYFRQILGLICGIVAGTLGFTGIFTIAGFLALNCLITYVYAYKYLGVEDHKVEQNTLFTESLMISFMNFVVSWIFSYTNIYLKATVPIPIIPTSTQTNTDL
ncbi:hypothetical protein ABPG74_012292 [Tetrahymena malaccensis]